MLLSSFVLPGSVNVLDLLADGNSTPPDTGAMYGLYGMLAAVGVAFIAGLFSLLTAKANNNRGGDREGDAGTASRRVAREHEAFERFILLNTPADTRKIETGYESMDEVRRA